MTVFKSTYNPDRIIRYLDKTSSPDPNVCLNLIGEQLDINTEKKIFDTLLSYGYILLCDSRIPEHVKKYYINETVSVSFRKVKRGNYDIQIQIYISELNYIFASINFNSDVYLYLNHLFLDLRKYISTAKCDKIIKTIVNSDITKELTKI